ncbi:hypothetical protein GCM10008179_12010 [Hansschlegelia plantiphila]|uniref:Serine protease n=2 Tax=Hansschlegelia plantiphila TaxID=374655 RepID=A0A9W6J0N5_9HYPH|nr:hypothetical protein GCM10008179_12010 [Hansschlegelia plantiphila]
MFFNQEPGGQGTCFLWRRQQRTFLVTALHNLTGQDIDSGATLDKERGLRPNHLIIGHTNFSGIIDETDIELYYDGMPVWFTHQSNNKIDIAAIEVKNYIFSHLQSINEIAQRDIILDIGADVFTIGYPFFTRTIAPIWKRGTIAAEIATQKHTEGFDIIDTATLPGMSGSPVVFRGINYRTRDSQIMTTQPVTKLMGVYSGRLFSEDKSKTDTQLARVWPERFINQIIHAERKDQTTVMP